jgi:hypothetical protein
MKENFEGDITFETHYIITNLMYNLQQSIQHFFTRQISQRNKEYQGWFPLDRGKGCCYIMVDSATTASQNSACTEQWIGLIKDFAIQ